MNRAENATAALVQAVRSARSIRPAPMFWPTSVDVAIDSPRAGTITMPRTRDPIPYAATVTVPNVATRSVISVIPIARVACSTDAGNPMRRIAFISPKSGLKSRRWSFTPHRPRLRRYSPTPPATAWVHRVASAAPATPTPGTARTRR